MDFSSLTKQDLVSLLTELNDGEFQFGSDIESLQVTVYDELEDWDFNSIARQYADEDGYYEYDEVVEGVLKDLFREIIRVDLRGAEWI